MSSPNSSQITRPPLGVNMQYSSWANQQNQTYSKPQYQAKGVHNKRRPGGGWEEEEETHSQTEPLGSKNTNLKAQGNKADTWKEPLSSKSESVVSAETNTSNKSSNDIGEYEVAVCDEDFLKTYEYENKIVNDSIQPGGARVKQPDSALNEFCNTCESIPPKVVGSLLLNKFNDNIVWISKARIIFAIEALSTKHNNYFDYFKHNLQVIRKVNFNHEGMNAIQLRHLMDSLTHILEQAYFNSDKQKENQIFTINPPQAQNNSNKPKPTMNPSKPAIVKAISSPVTSSIPIININNERHLQVQPNQNIQRNQPAQALAPTVQQPLNQNSNLQVPLEQSKPIPQAPIQKPAEPHTPTHTQVTQNPSAKLPLDQAASLIDSLSDLDFTNTSASTNMMSPNNIPNMYQTASPMNFPGMSPMNYMGGYMGNVHSPVYQNYPANNHQMQGGFNAYYNQHEATASHGGNPHYARQNSRHATYPGAHPQTPPQMQKYDQYEEMFKEVPEIDYDKEEKEKQRKRQENEKRFDSIDFKF